MKKLIFFVYKWLLIKGMKITNSDQKYDIFHKAIEEIDQSSQKESYDE